MPIRPLTTGITPQGSETKHPRHPAAEPEMSPEECQPDETSSTITLRKGQLKRDGAVKTDRCWFTQHERADGLDPLLNEWKGSFSAVKLHMCCIHAMRSLCCKSLHVWSSHESLRPQRQTKPHQNDIKTPDFCSISLRWESSLFCYRIKNWTKFLVVAVFGSWLWNHTRELLLLRNDCFLQKPTTVL